jgi:predicted O-methyltransferase YrrM
MVMQKIRKTLKALAAILRNPWLLNHVLASDEVWKAFLHEHHFPENGLPVVELDTLFPGFSETLETFAFLDGGSLPTDIALLKKAASTFSGCRYFEIGTWRGESVANVADVAANCVSLNLSKQEMVKNGLSQQYAALHGFFSQKRKNITHLEGNSLTFDFATLGQPFDLIFIDGNHHYEYVKNDTEKVFAHLVHDKSIVVWHDYAYHPEKVRPEVYAAIMEGTPMEKRKFLVHVANTMCAVYWPEKVETHPLETPAVPRLNFKVDLKAEKI